jgi:hypothetical protein
MRRRRWWTELENEWRRRWPELEKEWRWRRRRRRREWRSSRGKGEKEERMEEMHGGGKRVGIMVKGGRDILNFEGRKLSSGAPHGLVRHCSFFLFLF